MRKMLSAVLLGLILLPAVYGGQFWLKAGGGVATLNGGDYNRAVPGSNNLYRVLYTNVSGVLAKLDRGLDLALEAGVGFGRHWNLSVGLGYLSAKEVSNIAYDWKFGPNTYHDTIAIDPHFSAIELSLNAAYVIPIGPVRLNLEAGPGLYFCRFASDSDFTSTQLDWSYSYQFRADRVAPGVRGGVGIEVAVSRRLAVVLDVLGRYVRVNDIQGTGTVSGTIAGASYADSLPGQSFWYYEYVTGNVNYPQTSFQAFEPTSYLITNARKGRFDFTGVSATFGFKYSF